jgi:hypothetical protein
MEFMWIIIKRNKKNGDKKNQLKPRFLSVLASLCVEEKLEFFWSD